MLRKPWPGMLRGIWGDPKRYAEQYFSKFKDTYFTGDGARRDTNGYFWVMGRVDDVMNVAGHRLSTMEVESALVSHPKVAEAAVVGRPDEIKGTAIVCFVTLKAGQPFDPNLAAGAARTGREGDRRDRAARRHPLHRGAAEDALGQDHAAAAARHRGRPRERGRHDHARGFQRCWRSCANPTRIEHRLKTD